MHIFTKSFTIQQCPRCIKSASATMSYITVSTIFTTLTLDCGLNVSPQNGQNHQCRRATLSCSTGSSLSRSRPCRVHAHRHSCRKSRQYRGAPAFNAPRKTTVYRARSGGYCAPAGCWVHLSPSQYLLLTSENNCHNSMDTRLPHLPTVCCPVMPKASTDSMRPLLKCIRWLRPYRSLENVSVL